MKLAEIANQKIPQGQKTPYELFKDEMEQDPLVWLANQQIDSGEAYVCILHVADTAMKCLYRMVDNNPAFVERINRSLMGDSGEQV